MPTTILAGRFAPPSGAFPSTLSASGPLISDIVTAAFKTLDTSGDGVISAAELAAFQAKTGVAADAFKAAVIKVDSSGDGAITKAELTAYLTSGDTSGDGHVSFSEALAFAPLIGVHAGGGGYGGLLHLHG